jgi:hypothetical protein
MVPVKFSDLDDDVLRTPRSGQAGLQNLQSTNHGALKDRVSGQLSSIEHVITFLSFGVYQEDTTYLRLTMCMAD